VGFLGGNFVIFEPVVQDLLDIKNNFEGEIEFTLELVAHATLVHVIYAFIN
jgi:hypothetical protein